MIGDARAVEPLVTALKSENESLRFSAAGALRQIGGTPASETPLISAVIWGIIEMLKFR